VRAATGRPEAISPDAERRLTAFAELLALAISKALAAADRRRAEREADRQKDAFFRWSPTSCGPRSPR